MLDFAGVEPDEHDGVTGLFVVCHDQGRGGALLGHEGIAGIPLVRAGIVAGGGDEELPPPRTEPKGDPGVDARRRTPGELDAPREPHAEIDFFPGVGESKNGPSLAPGNASQHRAGSRGLDALVLEGLRGAGP